MLSYQSPGVYIEEIESGAKPIELAGTSTAAFLGFTSMGRAMEPVPLESYEAYASEFGGISKNGNEATDAMAFAVRAFFQNGGQQAYIVNVARDAGRASATVTAGRKPSPDPLFVVKVKQPGAAAHPIDVFLTPIGGLSSGRFELEIVENQPGGPRTLESYPDVTLAPGLPSSVERVVNSGNSGFTIEAAPGLRQLVFPAALIATSDVRGATDLKIQVMNDAAQALNVAWDGSSLDKDITALNTALQQLALPTGVARIIAERGGTGKIRFEIESTLEAATFVVRKSAAVGSPPETRGQMLAKLLTGGTVLSQAVLSGPVLVDPSRLSSQHLDVRMGTGFARRVGFEGVMRGTTMKQIADRIAQGLKVNVVPAALQSLAYRVEDDRCRISLGGTKLTDETQDGGNPKRLFQSDSDELVSARILAGEATMTVSYEDGGTTKTPQPGPEIKLSPGDSVADLVTALGNLRKEGGANAAKLLEVAVDSADPFVLKLKAKDSGLPVTFRDEGGNRLAGTLGLSNVTVAGTETRTGRFTTPADLVDLTLRLEESGATPPLDITVDLSAPDKVESVDDLSRRVESTLNAQPDGASPDPRVEFVRDRLLIWDPGQNVEVLTPANGSESGASLLSLTSNRGVTQAPMNDLQGNLPVMAALSGGDAGRDGGLGEYREALSELETRPEVSIICLPGHPWDKALGGTSYLKVQEAILHAKRQQDRMVIVDPPMPNGPGSRWGDQASVRGADLPTSSHVAIYYPWAMVPPPAAADGGGEAAPRLVPVAPSGFAAGVWSRTDRERGVWKAPAGVDARLYGLTEFTHTLTEIEGGALNREGVNALRNLRGLGDVVWGSRTAATNAEPQWKYLPVRRLALAIEDSLKETLAWAVHQPNRPELWSALRLNIEVFLNRLFQAGAFQPDTPKAAYFVQCGVPSTMSQADVDAGVVRVRIGIAPSKPAEFVVITIEQISEQG